MAGADLKHMTETEILAHSKALSGKSNADLADGMDLGEETVARYLRCPHDGERGYGLPIGRVRGWNRAAGNKVVLQWLCRREGGVFVDASGIGAKKSDVVDAVGVVHRESAEVIERLIAAMRDGVFTDAERRHLERELLDLHQAVEGALLSVRGRMAL